ncbi:MAG: site-specific integrase [Sphingobacteriales bacterium]|nr:MAG: site-specific integrase [Sphingobacteriales bacterium]
MVSFPSLSRRPRLQPRGGSRSSRMLAAGCLTTTSSARLSRRTSNAFDEFLRVNGANKSSKTIEWYNCSFNAIVPTDQKLQPVTTVIRQEFKSILLLEKMIENYLITTKHKGDTPENYYMGMHKFVEWCYEEGYIEAMPRWKRLKSLIPISPGKPIKIYSENEVATFIKHNQEISNNEAYFKRTRQARLQFAWLIRLLDETPLRIHEPLEAVKDDIDLRQKVMRVLSKDGKRWEYIPLTKTLLRLFDEMFEELHVKDKLFTWNRGNESKLRKYLHDTMTETQIERDGRGFHEFKKTYITRQVLRIGKDLSIVEVARLARCSIKVLEEHYLKMGTEHLRELLDREIPAKQ